MRQVARPKARFYTRFGILTDVVAMRRGSISPEKLVQTYRARAHAKDKAEALVETTFGWLLANHFKSGARIVQEWTSHRPMEPKVFLRKSQSTAQEYAKIAAMEGMTQNGWDLREWADIETINYIPRPNQV